MKTKITNKFFVMIISIAMIFTMLVGTAVVANAADGDACELCTYENGICSVCGGYQEATLTTDTYDMDGDGMNDSVYEIANAGQLYWFARLVNIDGQTTANGVLTAGIDLKDGVWYPIGLYEDPAEENGEDLKSCYAGTFDGQGYAVSNFKTSGKNSQGLFGYCEGAIIRNVGVINATVKGRHAAGVLAYNPGGTMTNCYAIDCVLTASAGNNTDENAGAVGAYITSGVTGCFAYRCTVVNDPTTNVFSRLAAVAGGMAVNGYFVDVTLYGGNNIEDLSLEATKTQLVSGELAYILNGNSLTGAWGQDLSSNNSYPIPNGEGLSAPHNAVIYSQNVNLGADLSMKYKVVVFDSDGYYENNALTMEFSFLGQKTVVEDYEIVDGLYVFTLEGINPQCMGDEISAVLYAEADEIDSKIGYSVKENLVNVYEAATDEVKQLIIDTLEYGAAAQVYRGYKTDVLVTDGVSFISDGKADTEVPESNYEYTGATMDSCVDEVTVHFSNTNHIKVKDQSGEFTLSNAIASYEFGMKQTFSAEGGYTLKYSVNDYCYDIVTGDYSEEMKALAKALYNYGLSAHLIKGNHTGGEASCTDRATCEICGVAYGSLAAHNMTYTSGGYYVEICCDRCLDHHSVAFINVDNKTYNGLPVEAVVNGTGYYASYTYNIVYSVIDGEELDSAPVNAGTYTASFTLEGATASVEFTIAPKTVGLEDVSLDKESYDYTGEEIKPAVIVDGVTLIEGTDYTATYVNNTDVGDATITITFCGNYFGAVVTMTFEIVTPQNTSSFDGAGTQPSASSAA